MIKNQTKYILLLISTVIINSCTTYINFYSKTFTEIPKKNMPVHRLDLSNQDLDSLPNSIISKMKDLKMLDLSGNPKLDLEKVFKKIPFRNNLEILTLDSLDITYLPKSIQEFTNLKQLSLAYNPKLDIEQTISHVSKLPLEFLSLKGNNIEILPDNIIEVTSVKDLNLSYNKLRDSINYKLLGRLPNLYSLWIDHNKLKMLPSSIGQVNQIRFLYIDHNELRELPTAMSDMKTWVVHAGYNKFTKLPEVFTKMQSLFMVHINNNEIRQIPEVYNTEKYPLAGLILDNNPIDPQEKTKAKKLFKGFFLLSFEQK